MSTRVLWQDIYAVEQQQSSAVAFTAQLTADPTFITTASVASGDGYPGIKGGVIATDQAAIFGMPLNEHVDLKAPNTTFEQEQARGISQRHNQEYHIVNTGEPAEATISMVATAYNISLFGYLLFQAGSSEVVGSANVTLNIFTGIPYVVADPEVYAYVTRFLQPAADSDDVDQIMRGCICSSLTLSAEKGGVLMLEAVMQGGGWSQKDLSALVASINFDTTASLKYQDMFAYMESTSMDIPSFTVTFSNNPVWNFYNDETAASVHLGRFTVEGSFDLPWGAATVGNNYAITKFLGGTQQDLYFFWGVDDRTSPTNADWDCDNDETKNAATDTKNYCGIKINARIIDYELGGDNEVVTTVNFQGAYDDTTAAGSLKAGYDLTKLTRILPV